MSGLTLLDTDVLSAVMKQHPAATGHAQSYLTKYGGFMFSIVTRYEIRRGLAARSATVQIEAFDLFCAANEVVPIDDRVITHASDLYGELRQRGVTISDADILIASTALVHGLTLATNNRRHFDPIDDLPIDNWLEA